MELWSVSNGFTGNGKVACLVEAVNAETARQLAGRLFEEEERKSANILRQDPRPSYWEDLTAVRVSLPYLGDEMP